MEREKEQKKEYKKVRESIKKKEQQIEKQVIVNIGIGDADKKKRNRCNDEGWKGWLHDDVSWRRIAKGWSRNRETRLMMSCESFSN